MIQRPAEEEVQIGDQYYVVVNARASRRTKRILSHGDLFAVFDVSGDVPSAGLEDLGVFFHGTRHLDRLELYVNRELPHFLASHVTADNVELVTDLTNADVIVGEHVQIPRDTIAIRRVKTLAHDRLHERIELRNYYPEPVRCELLIRMHADFIDIFELRGITRPSRGTYATPVVASGRVGFAYRGCDGRERRTTVIATPALTSVSADGFVQAVELPAGGVWAVELTVECGLDGVASGRSRAFADARADRRESERSWSDGQARFVSSNEFLNDWIARSAADVAMLRSENGSPCIYAGIPWFATLFGRDSIIAALETLAFAPQIAAGTLRRLAALQGTEENAERDEQPGKIVHEMRDDEMAACGEVPFGRYYGSVDATPLFLVLAAAYVRRTDDLELATTLWPHLERALEWIDRYGDRDGDGFVEYARETPRGLVNQGWKDSHDAIFHADGQLATPPIALVEVQGYVYAARRGLADIARRLGKQDLANELRGRAAALKTRFHDAFWLEDEGFYAVALDAEKRPCKVVTSNPGHCLYTGIVPPEVARRVAARMMEDDLFCGWGVRTLSSHAPRYNPMSYHNGSVWPHDNALLAAGLRRYGAVAESLRIATALFDTSRCVEDARLPELFCGFDRQDYGTPVPYPVACRPQAWAAASAFLFVHAMLGVKFDVRRQLILFDRPQLPSWLHWLTIRNVTLGDASIDVQVSGAGRASSSVEVLRRDGDVHVLVRK
ncbi:MAG: amylo-alpha-1,6-glucosidase [Deltaproteobacteria bacterium]|nr:MAG: amylo-alpha-1,6-glucosidase [Deltaproteobacteria bacterium]